jgi:hypothetical protein
MEALPMFFQTVKKKGFTQGHFLGFMNVLVGRRIVRSDGSVVSGGMGWRELANWLKKNRWDPEAVRELGQDPDALPPRDRYRFWFAAIAKAGIDTPAASEAGDRFAELLKNFGYEVGAAPKVEQPAESK